MMILIFGVMQMKTKIPVKEIRRLRKKYHDYLIHKHQLKDQYGLTENYIMGLLREPSKQ